MIMARQGEQGGTLSGERGAGGSGRNIGGNIAGKKKKGYDISTFLDTYNAQQASAPGTFNNSSDVGLRNYIGQLAKTWSANENIAQRQAQQPANYDVTAFAQKAPTYNVSNLLDKYLQQTNRQITTNVPGQSGIQGPTAQVQQDKDRMYWAWNPRGLTTEQYLQMGISPGIAMGAKAMRNRYDVNIGLYNEMADLKKLTPTFVNAEMAKRAGYWKETANQPLTNPSPNMGGYKMLGGGEGIGTPGWYLDVDRGYVHSMTGQSDQHWWMGTSANNDWKHRNTSMGHLNEGGGYVRHEYTPYVRPVNPSTPYTPYGYYYQALMNWRI
jgi:hypothetical protein